MIEPLDPSSGIKRRMVLRTVGEICRLTSIAINDIAGKVVDDPAAFSADVIHLDPGMIYSGPLRFPAECDETTIASAANNVCDVLLAYVKGVQPKLLWWHRNLEIDISEDFNTGNVVLRPKFRITLQR